MKQEKYQSKRLFSDIINGFSEFKEPANKNLCFVKHFNELDFANFESKKNEFYQKAIKLKLPTKEEKEKYIFDEGLWTKEADIEISNKYSYLENLKKSKSKLFLISQIEQINKEIATIEIELKLKKTERDNLIGYTAEKYSDNRMNIIHISNSIYKDKNLTQKLFSEEDLEDFDDKKFYDYIIEYNRVMDIFKEETIKKLAIENNVQILIGLCGDNLYYFYCKPLAYLTSYQSLLLLYGRYFRGIMMSEEYTKIPENIKEDPDKLMDWFTANKNLKDKTRKNNKTSGPSFIMGASDKDMKAIGGQENSGDINEIAKQKGGVLGVEELAKFYKR